MENPGFYSIIPADVRYSKINSGAKLLYSEITALCNKSGHCYAGNEYFSNLYGNNPRTISRWILCLISHGFIFCYLDQKGGNKRFLSIKKENLPMSSITEKEIICNVNPIDINVDTYRHKCLDPIDINVDTYRHKCLDPIDINVVYNNTMNNKSNNNIIIIAEEEEKKEKEKNIEIDNIDDLRAFLKKDELMEKYYWKIGSEQSWERMTGDFFIFCDEKGKKMKKRTINQSFVSYVNPKWETEEDREILRNIHSRRQKKGSIRYKKEEIFEKNEEVPELTGMLRDQAEIETESRYLEIIGRSRKLRNHDDKTSILIREGIRRKVYIEFAKKYLTQDSSSVE